jgi:antitoxin ParD1/3/4
MNLELDADLNRTIDELIRVGGYHSPQEVVREALDLLKSREAGRGEALVRLRREVQIGIDQIQRGNVHDAEQVFDDLLNGLPGTTEPRAQ